MLLNLFCYVGNRFPDHVKYRFCSGVPLRLKENAGYLWKKEPLDRSQKPAAACDPHTHGGGIACPFAKMGINPAKIFWMMDFYYDQPHMVRTST